MNTVRSFLLIFLALRFCPQCQAAPDQVTSFSTLSEGEQLEIKWLAIDCFSQWRAYEFTFQGSSNASVSIVSLGGQHVGNYYLTNRVELFAGLTNRVPLGRLALTKADLAGLDRLMQFYRQKRPAMTTVHDIIVVTQRRRGQIVAAEDFHDRSGGYFFEMSEGFRELPWLVAKLDRQNKQSKR